MNPAVADPAAAPSRVRYGVLFLLCLLAMLVYHDRGLVGNTKNELMAAIGRPATDFFWLLVAFQLAYALFEVPAGWLGDTFGPRGTLIRIVLWWSLFVGLTGMAGLEFVFNGTTYMLFPLWALVIMQFLFGMGEAGAFPNITRALYNWFPAVNRGFAQGAVWMSARLAGGLTPVIVVGLMTFGGMDWRHIYWLFAGLAGIWCIVFAWYFRNLPQTHSWTNQAERNLIGGHAHTDDSHSGVPWGKLIRSPNLWAICGMYFCTNYGWYFFMYFLPGFLKENFGPSGGAVSDWDKVMVALMAGGPLLLGIPGCYLGGILTDRYVRLTGDRRWGRRIYGILGFGMASLSYASAVAVLLLMEPGTTLQLVLFASFVALAGFGNDLSLAPSWAVCQDIGQRYSAIVAGCMNMIGNLGGTLTNLITGLIIQRYTVGGVTSQTGYVICLSMYATAFALGIVFWLKLDASRPIGSESKERRVVVALAWLVIFVLIGVAVISLLWSSIQGLLTPSGALT